MTYLDGYDPEIRMIFALMMIVLMLVVALIVLWKGNREKEAEIKRLKSERRNVTYNTWSASPKRYRSYHDKI